MFFHDTFFDQDVIQDEENGTEESNLNVLGQAPDAHGFWVEQYQFGGYKIHVYC